MAAPAISAESLPVSDRAPLILIPGIPSEVDPLTKTGIEIESRKLIGYPYKIDEGVVESYLYTFSDGSMREADATHPNKQRFDRAVMSSTMWLTGLKGYNQAWGENSVQKGMPAVLIGPEAGSFWHAVQQIGSVSLLHEAKLQFLIHDDLAKDGRFTERDFVAADYSRAAIIRQIMKVVAEEYGFQIPYTASLDSAPASKVDLSKIDPKEAVKYTLKEVGALGQGIAAYPIRDLGRLARTFSMRPQTIAQNIGTGIALGSGEAEEILARTPLDAVADMWFFKDSKLSRPAEAQERYKKHLNIRLRFEPGYHLTGADLIWSRRLMGNVALAQSSLKRGALPQEIDLDGHNRSVERKLKDGRF